MWFATLLHACHVTLLLLLVLLLVLLLMTLPVNANMTAFSWTAVCLPVFLKLLDQDILRISITRFNYQEFELHA